MWVSHGGTWRSRSSVAVATAFGGDGDMAARVRAFAWETTPLGARHTWSGALNTAASLVLATPSPMMLLWGEELTQIYNDGFCAFLSDKHPVALGQAARECWPEAWPFTARVYARVLDGERVIFDDTRYPHAQASARANARCSLTYSPVSDNDMGRVAGVLVTVSHTPQDVRTHHAEADRVFMIARDEDRTAILSALFASMESAVFVGTPDRISLANLEALRQVGCASIEEASRRIMTLPGLLDMRDTETGLPIAPDDQPFIRAFREGRRQTRDLRMRDVVTGDDRVMHCSALPVLRADGVVMSVVAVHTDMTERLQLEAQLRESHKMEAVGRLAGGIAHDFNNLLTVVIGNAQFALSDMAEANVAYLPLTDVLNAANRATVLTRQLLAFGRRQTLRPQSINLTRAAEEVSRLLRRTLGENIALRTSDEASEGAARPECFVWVDPGQLDQVLINLAINARDAMPRGGSLTIGTRHLDVPHPSATVPWFVRPGAYCMLSVADTGTGIPADVLPHIFEPFFSTKDVKDGSGLGLATVYGILKQSDGYVWAESVVGVGTTISVLLPRREESTPTSRVTPSDGISVSGEGAVLLVEDEEDIRHLYCQVLERAGYTVVEAPDGQTALERCEAQTFDIVVSDVIMPRVDGPSLVRRLRLKWPELPVILMSGYPGSAIPDLAALGGKVEFLQKPFGPLALLQLIGRYLGARAGSGSDRRVAGV